jgi:hypothetical protein
MDLSAIIAACLLIFLIHWRKKVAEPLRRDKPAGAKRTPTFSPQVVVQYVDVNGRQTTRGISNMHYSNSSYFHAYCHLRDEERTFCIHRIVEARDAETGEILTELHVRWGTNGRTRKYLLQENQMSSESLT